MNAPTKASLLKALEEIARVADRTLAGGTDTAPRVGPRLRPDQAAAVLVGGLKYVRALARSAQGVERWGRRPSLEPLPAPEPTGPAMLDVNESKGRAR